MKQYLPVPTRTKVDPTVYNPTTCLTLYRSFLNENLFPPFLPAHIFVQQPTHFTFHLIPRLEECMNHVYNSEELAADCALSASELVPSLVCVCKVRKRSF